MTTILTYRGAVYPWHCDHIGHMNNMWYAGKFDEASWNFLAQLGITPSYLRDTPFGMAALEQTITFKRELMAGDVVEVNSHIVDIGDKLIRFTHAMTNGATGELAATCAITGIHMDRSRRKSCPFPDTLRSRLATFEAPRRAA